MEATKTLFLTASREELKKEEDSESREQTSGGSWVEKAVRLWHESREAQTAFVSHSWGWPADWLLRKLQFRVTVEIYQNLEVLNPWHWGIYNPSLGEPKEKHYSFPFLYLTFV